MKKKTDPKSFQTFYIYGGWVKPGEVAQLVNSAQSITHRESRNPTRR